MDSVEFIKNTPSDELYKHHLKVVFETYYKLFGEVCQGCPHKISGYISRIKKYNKSEIMEKSKFNYRLKKGAIIPVPGTNKAYSNENLTEEFAIAFLRKNPNRKKLFTLLPDNIDEILDGKADAPEATSVKVGDREYSVEEGVAILGQIGVTTKAETIEGVQKRFDGLKKAERQKLEDLFKVAGNINTEGQNEEDPENDVKNLEVVNSEILDGKAE